MPENILRLSMEKSMWQMQKKKSDNGRRIQDAHEAIRPPTDIARLPAQIKESLSRDQFRLYQLIWKRFTASRMQQARYETTSVKVQGGEYYFTASASKRKFDGFMTVYIQEDEEKQENQFLARNLEEDTQIGLKGLKEQPAFHPASGTLYRKRPWSRLWKNWGSEDQAPMLLRSQPSSQEDMWQRKTKIFI